MAPGKPVLRRDIELFNLYWYDWKGGVLLMPIAIAACSAFASSWTCLVLTPHPDQHPDQQPGLIDNFSLHPKPLYEVVE